VAKPIDVERLMAVLQRHLQHRPATIQPPPVWDQANGIRRTGGNVGLYRRLMATFTAQEADVAQRIRAAVAAADLETADSLAHALKGVAGNLGLGRLVIGT
jgi:two-component system, sensor histidine kinase and response regulator